MQLQRRGVGALVDDDAAFGAKLCERLVHAGDVIEEGLEHRVRVVARHGAHVEDEAAFAGEDVGRGAAADLADGDRRP